MVSTIIAGLGTGSNGDLVVSSGGSATNTTVHGNGLVLVYSGGTTIGDMLLGSGPGVSAIETLSGGTASGATLSNTGILVVSSGGVAVSTLVQSTGLVNGSAGALQVLLRWPGSV